MGSALQRHHGQAMPSSSASQELRVMHAFNTSAMLGARALDQHHGQRHSPGRRRRSTWALSAATWLASSSASPRGMPLNPRAPCCLQGEPGAGRGGLGREQGGGARQLLVWGARRRPPQCPAHSLGLGPHAAGRQRRAGPDLLQPGHRCAAAAAPMGPGALLHTDGDDRALLGGVGAGLGGGP